MSKIRVSEKVFISVIVILFIVIFSIFGFIIYQFVIKTPEGTVASTVSPGLSTKIDINLYEPEGDNIYKLDEYYYGYKVEGHINIPKTNVDLPILELSVDAMKYAPCLVSSENNEGLNSIGLSYIEGHNLVNGTQFSDNYKLEEGDEIYITSITDNLMKKYEIIEKYITTAEDISFLQRDTQNNCDIAIQTCTNDGKKRIIIIARMVKS